MEETETSGETSTYRPQAENATWREWEVMLMWLVFVTQAGCCCGGSGTVKTPGFSWKWSDRKGAGRRAKTDVRWDAKNQIKSIFFVWALSKLFQTLFDFKMEFLLITWKQCSFNIFKEIWTYRKGVEWKNPRELQEVQKEEEIQSRGDSIVAAITTCQL